MNFNDNIQLMASKRHKETSLEHKTQWICCWLVARVLQLEIRFEQMLAVILSWMQAQNTY